MANDVVNVTEGSGKAIATETVTTLNAQTVTARDVQRVGLVNISGDGIADDITPLGEGTPIIGQSLETGGAGALGWFASIRKKIAAFGTAGAPSADVLTVQGVSGGTALPVTLSGTPATLADGMSKPTTSALAAWLFGYNGATGDLVRVQSFRVDLNAISITAIATVWAPTSGKRFRLMGGSISVSAACSVVFEDGAAGAANFVWRTPKLVADTPYNFDLGNGRPSATINTTLKATASVAATITGTLYGVEE